MKIEKNEVIKLLKDGYVIKSDSNEILKLNKNTLSVYGFNYHYQINLDEYFKINSKNNYYLIKDSNDYIDDLKDLEYYSRYKL